MSIIECLYCGATYTGSADEAWRDGWSQPRITADRPDAWLCPPCHWDAIEQPARLREVLHG